MKRKSVRKGSENVIRRKPTPHHPQRERAGRESVDENGKNKLPPYPQRRGRGENVSTAVISNQVTQTAPGYERGGIGRTVKYNTAYYQARSRAAA